MKTYITVYFGTVLVAMFLVPIVSRLAKRYRLVDAPGPRKVHQTPIPRIGGVAFVISTLVLVLPVFFLDNAIGESFRESWRQFITLLVGAGFIFAVGLIDDLHPVRGYVKLLCLVAASLAICASGATLRSISVGTWFELETGWAAWPLTLCWIVVITVCMNVIDGLDGLAAGIAAMVCGTILLLAFLSGQVAMVVLMLALLGSVTGFLFFNFYPAKIFMGDCGSMFLGFMIGAGSIVCQTKTSTFVGLALPLLVMGVPILDTGLVVASRRLVERRSMFAPDGNHLHHRLLKLGLHHRAVVIIMYAVTAVSASLGLLTLTAQGKWSVGFLAGGLVLLFSMFACLHGGRWRTMLKGLKRNWAIAREARADSHGFEKVQVQMHESRSFPAWWKTVCVMAKQMRFQSIGLLNRRNDHYTLTCVWNAPGGTFTTGRTMKVTLPLNGNGATEWEIRARIWVDDCLELSGRQAMLLARLMDEFPPPEQEQEAERLGQPEDTADQSKAGEKAAPSMTMTNVQTLTGTAHAPAPLDIMGIPVVPFESYNQALESIERTIEADSKSFWVAINPVKIYNAWHDSQLQSLLRQADVGICDGVGISIASKVLHGRSIKRCTGCDLFFRLLSLACRKGWGVYLLGASDESNAAARSRLLKLYPDLKIVGWQDGYFEDSHTVVKQINRSKAKLLFVALGSPKQEYWIWRHRRVINANFCMGVGGSFDVASGRLTRAPKISRVTGTEFLYRLITEPRKRWRIQKVLIPYFMRVVEKKLVDFFISDKGHVDQVRR